MTKVYWKINLINLNIVSLKRILKFLKIREFIYKQLLMHIYQKNVCDILLISNIKLEDRILLNSVAETISMIIKKKIIDQDNTIKLVFEVFDYNTVETVLIPNRKNHFTLCLSSQVGCVLNCSFCYTGKFKFVRNLRPFEIISQLSKSILLLQELLKYKVITNIVFMGMGEPLFNISNLLVAIEVFVNCNAFDFSRNKITISSSGLINKFNILKREHLRLALSLHASNNFLRSNLMSISKKYSLTEIIKECHIFTSNEQLTIEYIMLKNVNDSEFDALELVSLLKNLKCKVCLIPFNYFPGSSYECSFTENILHFKRILKEHKVVTTIRKSMGLGVYGACGQLSGSELL